MTEQGPHDGPGTAASVAGLDAVLADFTAMSGPLVSDVLDGLGRRDCVMVPGLAPVVGDGLTPTVGWAYPVRVRCTDEFVGIDRLLEMIDSVPPASTVVITADKDTGAALWGGLCSVGVMRRGAVGAVADGGVRDLRQIAKLGFPVYATSTSPRDIRGRGEVVAFGEPITCRGVRVRAGDLVVADANGVVVVPAELVDGVRMRCLDRLRREDAVAAALRDGDGARETYARHQVF